MSDAPPSPLDRALTRVGDRWSLLVVEALLPGPLRFADLQERVPAIATNVLSARLKHLEAQQLAVAVRYSGRPARFAYELTDTGRRLAGAVRMLRQWGADLEGLEPGRGAHLACGTALEARWWCPTCDQVVADAEAVSGDGDGDGEELTWL